MSLSGDWIEIRLKYSGRQNQDSLFDFKKKQMLRILDEHKIGYFFTLDQRDFTLIRFEGSNELADRVKTSFEELHSDLFSDVVKETWSPLKNAHTRIIESRVSAGLPPKEAGWKITGMNIVGLKTNWQYEEEDLNRQQEAFATFMARVAGEFTRAYLKEMPYRVKDRWMISLYIHLLLDSISTWHEEEYQSRAFDFV
jgi:hypothetical protein